MKRTYPTQERLRTILDYNPETGLFFWKIKFRGQAIGTRAGSINSAGRIHIKINHIHYEAGRLAWIYTFGNIDDRQIDHINCDPADNRIFNLRLATQSQNHANTRKPRRDNPSSQLKGAVWNKKAQKWQSIITCEGKRHYLGLFDSDELAHQAYMNKAQELFGQFSRAS